MYLSEDVICNFLRLAIDQLKPITPAEQHRWETTRIQRRENGYAIHFSTRPDFSLITALGHFRHQIPSINSLVENLEKDTRFQHLRHATSVRWLDLEPDQIALSLLRSYVNQINELKYDEELAIQVAKNFLLSLDKGHSDVTLYCVVRGLNCDFDKYMLPDGIQLRKLTDDEIVKLIDHNPGVAHEDLMPSNCCLLEKRLALPVSQLPLEVNPVSKQPLELVTEDFDAVITALRLLKDGRVERQNVYIHYDHPGQLIVPNMSGRSSALTYRFAVSQTYELSQEQLPTLVRIITAIKSGSIPVKMRTAVDRVNFAVERDRADDKLLDLLIAMEAIYGDSPGAIGYKIGMRCAVFVETDFERRDTIRKLINDAYNRRSALVHGGKKVQGDLNLTTDQVVDELLALVRKSINRIIERLLSGEKIPSGADFDRILISSAAN